MKTLESVPIQMTESSFSQNYTESSFSQRYTESNSSNSM